MDFKCDEFDEEQFTTFLSDVVKKVKSEEDPLALAKYRKLYKKTVPFTLRMYVAAYFSKAMFENSSSSQGKRGYYRENKSFDRNNRSRDSRSNNGRGGEERNTRRNNIESKNHQTSERFSSSTENSETQRPAPRRVVIDESLAKTIFISVGRNRHAFARELISLLVQKAHLDRDRIGTIRVLDNYSFVQLFAEDTDMAIEALNGFEYRGRKLTVGNSYKRDDSSTEEDASKMQSNNSSNAVEKSADFAAGSDDSDNTSMRDNGMDSSLDDNTLEAEDAAAFAAAEAAFAADHPNQVIGVAKYNEYGNSSDDDYNDSGESAFAENNDIDEADQKTISNSQSGENID